MANIKVDLQDMFTSQKRRPRFKNQFKKITLKTLEIYLVKETNGSFHNSCIWKTKRQLGSLNGRPKSSPIVKSFTLATNLFPNSASENEKDEGNKSLISTTTVSIGTIDFDEPSTSSLPLVKSIRDVEEVNRSLKALIKDQVIQLLSQVLPWTIGDFMELPMLEPMFCDLPLDGMGFETNCSCFFFQTIG